MVEEAKAAEERIPSTGKTRNEDQSNVIMNKVLDNLGSMAYVIDFDSYNLLFANKPMRDALGENYKPGLPCWQIIRPDIGGPCPFCKKDKLVDEQGNPIDISISYDVFNALLKRWYLVNQTLIDWTDGSKAVLLTTTDITERKTMEKQLEFMASTDTATGAYNRGWGLEKFEELCALAAKEQSDVTIAILDIDYLKKTNDRYGHIAGDMLIKTVADIVRENISEDDVFIRIGGDEFMIVFGDPRYDTASMKMVSISSQVSDINNIARFPFVCSVSYGLKSERAIEGNFADSLIAQADALMYEAKRLKH